METEFIERFEDTFKSTPKWAWPYKPSIPLVGKRYKPGKGLLIYASAENLSWLNNEPTPPRFKDEKAWNRYRIRYEEVAERNSKAFFPDVGIQPVNDGGLFAAGLFISQKMGLPTSTIPRAFLETEVLLSCLQFVTDLAFFTVPFFVELRCQNHNRLHVMRKVWIYKRKNIRGWWVGWYESGRRKAKALPSKKLAEHYCRIKYTQLNSDVFTGTVTADWQQMAEEYRHCKEVAGVTEVSLYEAALTLRHFERIIGKRNSKQITQDVIDRFILERGKEVKRSTLNKDIRNLKSFINWCRKNRYLNGEIEICLLKEAEKPVRALNSDEIKRLIFSSRLYRTVRIRILLALGTGLRRGDIEMLKISNIDFAGNNITTMSMKTGKVMGGRLVSGPIMAELSQYVSRYAVNQERLFSDKFNSRQWKKICQETKLEGLKFHDLRKTFCSILAQNGISTAVTQKLLEHSSPQLTNKVYTNVDPVLRQAVNKIPVGDWL